jgi:hypothetical protein
MAAEFIFIDRNTPLFVPANVQNYISQGHQARFIVETVYQLDL